MTSQWIFADFKVQQATGSSKQMSLWSPMHAPYDVKKRWWRPQDEVCTSCMYAFIYFYNTVYFKMGRTTHDFILFSWASQLQVPVQASTTLHLLYHSLMWIPCSHHRLFPVSSPNYPPSQIRRAPGCFPLFVVVVNKWYLKEFEKLFCDLCNNKHIT